MPGAKSLIDSFIFIYIHPLFSSNNSQGAVYLCFHPAAAAI